MVFSSQLQLPNDLPFHVISRTIGQGAYAFIRKARPLDSPEPVFAVKFINKEHAFKVGRLRPKQLHMEIALHDAVGKHQNIIQFMRYGDTEEYTWIAMELADGDLFDKIEADVGVAQDIAHFYFSQLISAVGYMHSRNVAHRDIKPENILLSPDGDLKLADFGLAVLYCWQGQEKLCKTVCGSPPYMAPEVVSAKTQQYEGRSADVWSCGIVLFVLLVGNTPWDEPTRRSEEFCEFVDARINEDDELWSRIPPDALSLLRGMLKLDPKARFTLEDVRRHPWFTQYNHLLSSDGRAADPIHLATKMFENLRVDINAPPPSRSQPLDAMDTGENRLAFTQPETPVIETVFDWERPVRIMAHDRVSMSQPVARGPSSINLSSHLLNDIAMSQFSATPAVPESLTQAARRFHDIIPQQSLARFLSFMDFQLILPLVSEALGRIGIPTPPVLHQGGIAIIKVKTLDQRRCPLVGNIQVERLDEEVIEVRFLKSKGDPLEWRRLFKKVVVLCKDGIYATE